jgi:alkaline phosphatase
MDLHLINPIPPKSGRDSLNTSKQPQNFNFRAIATILLTLTAVLTGTILVRNATAPRTGNVIFIHPDGTSASHWGAARMLYYGPDGRLNWDKMSNLAVYLGHLKNQLTGTSNAGAVVHATGVKVDADSFGLDANGKPVTALSGENKTILQEAIAAGKSTAVINSGVISEPGTGAFLAKVNNRRNHAEITKQIIESGTTVILGGGEMWYLPKGVAGRHTTAAQSQRIDGLNLIETAKSQGYTVVYTREELLNLPANTTKVLGIFAAEDTYNDQSEEKLKAQKLPNYVKTAPTVGEQLQVALRILSQNPQGFFVVLEEEGADNFCNNNNAKACLEAIKRADDAIGIAMNYIEQDPKTLLVTTADSDAGGLEVIGEQAKDVPLNQPLPAKYGNGAPIDGRDGTKTLPFISAPDKNGQRFSMAIAWSGFGDKSGGIISKAHGLNGEMLQGTVDNTDIYRVMYATLFGTKLP